MDNGLTAPHFDYTAIKDCIIVTGSSGLIGSAFIDRIGEQQARTTDGYDPKTEIRKIPALFAQTNVAHRHAPQFGNFQYASGSRTARASRPILQTERLI